MWTIGVYIGLALLAWLSTSFGSPLARAGMLSPSELLNTNGTLSLTKGIVGTVDIRGWNVRVDPRSGPVFATEAPTASNWSALGNGVNNLVVALAVIGGDVYVGGAFSEVCGNAACDSGNTRVNGIAKWNDASWSKVGNGVDLFVTALAASGSDVYVTGFFTEVCGNDACDSGNMISNNVAKWNGASWAKLGNGVGGPGAAVAVSGSDVFVGGTFAVVCGNATCQNGNITVNNAAKFSCNSKPAKPKLTAPADGTLLQKARVTLKWNDVACETKYKVRVKNAATNRIAFHANLDANVTQVKTSALPKDKTYKWFVRACDSFGCVKSAVREFALAP